MTNTVAPNGSKREQLVTREKHEPIHSLRSAVNRLFDEFSWGFPLTRMLEDVSGYSPKVDIKDTDNQVVVTVELAGVDPKDVEVKVYGESLVIAGEKKEETEEKTANYYHMERRFGAFQRVLPLPMGVDTNAIDASTANGVLTIKVPKTKAAQQAKKIEIKTK